MALVATNKGKSIKPCPAGAHIARCYAIVDLGTQPDSYMGTPKDIAKCRIFFEVPGETYVFDESEGPKPYGLSKKYTKSTSDKSTLRKDLESWRGRKFTDEEIKCFDITKIVGAPCMINVVHKASKQDSTRIFADIAAIMPMPKGMACPAQVNPKVIYTIEEGKSKTYEALPDWVKEEVAKAREFHVETPANHPGEDEGQAPEGDDADNSCPF